MKISSFEIERFGIWSNLTVSKLFDGVNVFYGANEAGKSTIMEFIRSALYGFNDKRRQYARRSCGQNLLSDETEFDCAGNPLYAISGGILNLESSGGVYALRRMFHPDNSGGGNGNGSGGGNFETVELRNINGEKESAQLLRVLISGVDEQTFNNVFAIGLDEIQRIGTLSNTDAAEMLFQLSVGMERVSIVDTIKELTNRRNHILSPHENDNKPALLSQLINERKKILDEIDESKLLVQKYVQLKDELKTVDRSVAILEDDIAALEREKRLYEIAKLVEPIWIKRNKIRNEIDAMGKIPAAPDEIIQKLDKLTNNFAENKRKLQDIKTEYELAQEEIKLQPVNESLLKFAPRLEVLLDEEVRIIEVDSQIASIENEIKSITSRISDADNLVKRGRRATSSAAVNLSQIYQDERPVVANLSEHDSAISAAANVTPPEKNIFAGYRTVARTAAKAKRKLHRIKEQYAEVSGKAKVLGGKLKPELATRNVNAIGEAIDNSKELIAALRRRQVIGQNLYEMSLTHRELHRANAVLIQSQTSPAWQIALIGLVVILGVIPAGLALFEALGVRAFEAGVHPVLILGGLLMSGGVVAYKFISEKANAGKLKQNQQRLNGLISQINYAKQEAADIDSRFPDIVVSSIEGRCRELQLELQSLEKLLPVENQYHESTDQLKKIELRLQRCKEFQLKSSKRWRDWLRSVGLPADWYPARVRELVEHNDTAYDLRRELERLRLILDQRMRDMRAITERIDRTIAEAGLTFAEGVSYVDILRNIKSMLEANDIAVKNRDKLRQGLRPFKKRRRGVVLELREVRLSIAELLRQYRVKSVEEMRELNKSHQKRRRLLQQEQAVQREIDAAIGNFCQESVIADILELRIAKKLRNEFAQNENKSDAGIEIIDNNAEINFNGEYNNNINNIKNNEIRNGEIVDNNIDVNDDVNYDADYDVNYNVVNDGGDDKVFSGGGGDEVGELGEVELLTLEQLLLRVSGRLEVQGVKLRGELELRGKLLDQLKLLAEDQTFYRKRRELAVIEERIRLLKMEWQVYAICCLMLDLIRESYERERQPKTLAEASELLKQLTDGKYVRIWTPLGERTLMVDDEAGNTCDIGWISRGTRELLFIALRLALASAFAQHGSVLPVILDDVLVNFDAKRSRAMAKVLIEYAKSGRQIFVFTCHEHVCRIFQGLDIPVRILPPVNEPKKIEKILLPKSILKKREAKRRLEIQQLAKKQLEEKIKKEIEKREQQIRIEEERKAEVQRMILQIQQQATAAITVEQNRKELQI